MTQGGDGSGPRVHDSAASSPIRRTDPTTSVISRAGLGSEAATVEGESVPFDWRSVRAAMASGHHITWLTTVSSRGVPHVVPVFAAWDGAHCFVATNASARKTRDLQDTGRCVPATDLGDAHVVVEATATRVHGPDEMARAVTAFRSCYGWPTTADGDQRHAPYAAPTSGGSPFQVWELAPVKAFGFAADGESNAPTRWSFTAAAPSSQEGS